MPVETKRYLWERADLSRAELSTIKKGIALHDPEALLAGASLYHRGILGYERDEARAMRLLDDAMATRYPQAYYLYAQWLEEGDNDSPEMKLKALKFFERAANLGFGRAMAQVGYFFMTGRGVKKDLALAGQWLISSRSYASAPLLDQLAVVLEEENMPVEAAKMRKYAREYRNLVY